MSLAAGMDDYLSKPIRIDELVEALSKSRPLATSPEPGEPAVLDRESEVRSVASDVVDLATEAAVLDSKALENLLSMLGGEFDYLVELIDSFLEDAPQLLAELNQYIEGGDAAGVHRMAHSLKSNGADFGATTFSNLCKELEMMAKSGALDGAAELAAKIVTEYAKVEMALAAVRREGRIGG
jgi:HPt (histidine-containing phosphotransfer) domain-containing protein